MLMEVDISSGHTYTWPCGATRKRVYFYQIFNRLEAWSRTRQHAKHAGLDVC
jgi:hypothetical protein